MQGQRDRTVRSGDPLQTEKQGRQGIRRADERISCRGRSRTAPFLRLSRLYGDERALPVFMGTIEREDIDYVLFQELKFAIEALGGEYNKERDFSSDENYQKIMAAEAREIFPKNWMKENGFPFSFCINFP